MSDTARSLIEELVDPDDCWYDHHGYCQAHSLDEKPCPHERTKAWLAMTQDDDHCTKEEREVIEAALGWRRVYADVFSFESGDRPKGLTDAELLLEQAVDALLAARAKTEEAAK